MLSNRSLFPILKRIILPVLSIIFLNSISLIAQKDTCVHIDFETVNGDKGDTVCVNVKVSNFKGILSFQFPIVYDPRVVTPIPVTNIASFVGFNDSSINLDSLTKTIRIFYSNPNNDTVNLSDNTILFTICFKLVGAPGDCSKITFSDRPIITEFIQRNLTGDDIPICVVEDNPDDLIKIKIPTKLCVLSSSCGTLTNTGNITIKAWGGREPYLVTCPTTAPPTNSNIIKGGDCIVIGNQVPGTYTFTITDGLGVSTMITVTITASSNINITQDINYSRNPTCWYSSNGRAGINVNGGSGPLFIKWLPLNTYGVKRINGLTSGVYTAVVSDTNGCSQSFVIPLLTDTLKSFITIDKKSTCNGFCDGEATVRATGGTPFFPRRYEFIWSMHSKSDCSPDTVCMNDSLCGKVFVVIKDANTCQDTIFFDIPVNNIISSAIKIDSIKCFGDTSARINAVASSNNVLNLPVTFDFRNANNTSIPGGTTNGANFQSPLLTIGTYYLRIIDNLGCEHIDTIKITQPLKLDFLENQIDTSESCSPGGDALLDIRGVDGTGPYQYAWSNLVNSNRNTNLSIGTYTVTITDAHLCSLTKTYTVTKPIGPKITGFNNKNINCLGDTSGCVEVLFTTGNSPVKIKWNIPSDSAKVCSLGAGTYTVTLTDQSGCMDTASTKILTVVNPIIIDSVVLVNPSCPGKSDGIIIVFAKGGSGLLTYNWSNKVNTLINPSIKAGKYILDVDDIGGCSGITDTFELFDRPRPVINVNSILEPSCTETASCDASMFSTVTTTDSIVVFTWSSGEQTRYVSTSGSFQDTAKFLCSGRQYVIISVNDLCSDTVFFDIKSPPKISFDSTQLVLTKPSCYGRSDGSISIDAKGGCKPYNFEWQNPVTNGPLITGLKDGYYKVKITDCRGCVHFDSVRLRQPDTIRVQIIPGSTDDVSCPGKQDGRITLVWNGGSGGKGIFNWNPGNSKDSVLTGLSAGNYSVTITDKNNCTGTASVNIKEPPPMTFQMTEIDTPPCKEDQIDFSVLQVFGGLGPDYKFTIDNAAPNPIGNIVPLYSGTYKITIYDKNGCTKDTMITVPNPSNDLSIDFGRDSATIALGDSIRLIGLINTLVPIATYEWAPSNTVSNPNSNDSYVRPGSNTLYVLTVTDENGCSASDKIAILVESVRHFYAPNIFSPNGDNTNDFLEFYVGSDVASVDVVEVYDRWGGRIYSAAHPPISNNSVRTWDGKFHGDLVMPGVYVYYAKINFLDGYSLIYKGDITVVR